MNKLEIVTKFREGLNSTDEFKVVEVSELVWKISSQNCVLTFLFERNADVFNISVEEPNLSQETKPMAMLLLRFLRGAADIDMKGNSPVFFADLMNSHFPDLLEGDFSLREEYERVFDRFYAEILSALFLKEDNPIRIKVENFDISWLDDIA